VKRIVVDASVVLAGLFKDGAVRHALLTSELSTFTAPRYIDGELDRHIPDVVQRSGLPRETILAVLEDLVSAVDLVPPGVYAMWLERATGITRRASAAKDTEYVALALSLGAPVWTLDKAFRRMRGIKTVLTSEIG